jgi:hypothetical protein
MNKRSKYCGCYFDERRSSQSLRDNNRVLFHQRESHVVHSNFNVFRYSRVLRYRRVRLRAQSSAEIKGPLWCTQLLIPNQQAYQEQHQKKLIAPKHVFH